MDYLRSFMLYFEWTKFQWRRIIIYGSYACVFKLIIYDDFVILYYVSNYFNVLIFDYIELASFEK